MSALAGALLDVLQIAHDTGFQHSEPVRTTTGGGGGGASTVVILAGVLVTLLAVGGLVWLKRRTDA